MSDATQAQQAPERVECPVTKDLPVRLFIFAVMLIGFGAWCFVEAYVTKKFLTKPEPELAAHYFNAVCGIVLPLAGLVSLVWGIRALRRRLVADAEGIGYVGGQKIPWSAARSLDTSKLAGKGILYLTYDTGRGQERMTLDSWRLQNFRELALLVEKKVAARD